jgi:hypothetical protein
MQWVLQVVGGLFVFGELAVGWNGGPVCGEGN